MVWLRSTSFLLFLTFVSHAMAMYGSPVDEKDEMSSSLQVHVQSLKESSVKQEITKIESIVEKLRNISPTAYADNYNKDKACDLLNDQAPEYNSESSPIKNLYQSVNYVDSGGSAHVWKAILKMDRPQAGLKANDVIAVRMVWKSGSLPLEERHKSTLGFEGLIRSSRLRNLKDERGITEYFPNFYGIYYGPLMPNDVIVVSPDDKKAKYAISYMKESQSNFGFRYEEMEWVDTTFQKKFTEGETIPDSVLFEYMYGEWAAKFFLGISFDDRRSDNYGLKNVNYGRSYHFGEDHYYFPPGETPVRLDLHEIRYCHTPKKFYGSFPRSNPKVTQEGKNFLHDLSNQTNDLFTLFSQHFGNYRKEWAWIEQNDPMAKHYFLEQKHVDAERTLPKG